MQDDPTTSFDAQMPLWQKDDGSSSQSQFTHCTVPLSDFLIQGKEGEITHASLRERALPDPLESATTGQSAAVVIDGVTLLPNGNITVLPKNTKSDAVQSDSFVTSLHDEHAYAVLTQNGIRQDLSEGLAHDARSTMQEPASMMISGSSESVLKEQEEESRSSKRRKVYYCSKCGKPKKGHTCLGKTESKDDSSVAQGNSSQSQRAVGYSDGTGTARSYVLQVPCTTCQAALQLGFPSTTVSIQCPHCGAVMVVQPQPHPHIPTQCTQLLPPIPPHTQLQHPPPQPQPLHHHQQHQQLAHLTQRPQQPQQPQQPLHHQAQQQAQQPQQEQPHQVAPQHQSHHQHALPMASTEHVSGIRLKTENAAEPEGPHQAETAAAPFQGHELESNSVSSGGLAAPRMASGVGEHPAAVPRDVSLNQAKLDAMAEAASYEDPPELARRSSVSSLGSFGLGTLTSDELAATLVECDED